MHRQQDQMTTYTEFTSWHTLRSRVDARVREAFCPKEDAGNVFAGQIFTARPCVALTFSAQWPWLSLTNAVRISTKGKLIAMAADEWIARQILYGIQSEIERTGVRPADAASDPQ